MLILLKMEKFLQNIFIAVSKVDFQGKRVGTVVNLVKMFSCSLHDACSGFG